MKQLKIGRSNTNDVVISDPAVSGQHLELFADNEGNVFITDLNSSNGTFVNGKQISGSAKLYHNDIVKIGNTVLPWRNYLKDEFTAHHSAVASYEENEETTSSGADAGSSFSPKKKNNYSNWITGGLILIGIVVIIVVLKNNSPDSSSSDSDSYEETSSSLEDMEADSPAEFLSAGGTWRENVFSLKFIINGTITNSASIMSYNRILIRVSFYDEFNSYINYEDYYVYETVDPGRTIDFKLEIERYTNVYGIGWEVADAEPVY